MSIARIRKGDTVIVLSGNHKKAVRRTERTQGGLVEREFPIRLCKLMPYDAEAKKGSRVGTAEKDGKKARLLKASGKII